VNSSGVAMRPIGSPLADLIPENNSAPYFASPKMNSQKARRLNSASYFATARLPDSAADYLARGHLL